MNHRTPAHVRLQVLIAGLPLFGDQTKQANDPTMGEMEPMLAAQPILDLSAGQPFDGCHGGNAGDQARAEPAATKAAGGERWERGQDTASAGRALTGDEQVLGDMGRGRSWELDNLDPTMDPAPHERGATAGTGVCRMPHLLIHLRHPLSPPVVRWVPACAVLRLALLLGVFTRPGARSSLDWSAHTPQSLVLGLKSCHLLA